MPNPLKKNPVHGFLSYTGFELLIKICYYMVKATIDLAGIVIFSFPFCTFAPVNA